MTFKKGEKPPSNLKKLPGRNAARTVATRDMAVTVRESVSTQALCDYWTLIAMGKPGVHLDIDEDGEYFATWNPEGGITPTRSEMDGAVRELLNRGWGLPAQSIHLEGHLKGHFQSISANLQLGPGHVSPAQLALIRDVMLGNISPAQLTAGSSTDDSSDPNVIDVEPVEVSESAVSVANPGEDEGTPGGMELERDSDAGDENDD